MLYHKRHTIADRCRLAIADIEANRIYSALVVIDSIEQTAIQCGAKPIKHLLPKAYLLTLCLMHTEAVAVLHQVKELATHASRRRRAGERSY